MLQTPAGYQRTVAHVGFLNLVAWLDARQLGHQSVHHIGVVLALVGLLVGSESQFHQLVVGNVVETEQVGTCLLDGVAVVLQRIGVDAWQQLSAAMPQTLVQVGMQVVANIAVFVDERNGLSVNHELFPEPIAAGGLVVGLGQIAYRDALASVLCPYPVSIGQVDADGCRGVLVAAEHGRTNHVGRHALHFGLAEARVNGRMVFKPLGIV